MSLAKVKAWSGRMDMAREERDEAIRQAHIEGKTMRAIAEAARLTPGRVHQIIHALTAPEPPVPSRSPLALTATTPRAEARSPWR